MAARLTDKQKKQLVADYMVLESYRAVARLHGVSADSVKRAVEQSGEFVQKAARKKEDDAGSVLTYMGDNTKLVCEIIGRGLSALLDDNKLKEATPSQITTMIGTLIDKWTGRDLVLNTAQKREDDALTRSLREEAARLDYADQ